MTWLLSHFSPLFMAELLLIPTNWEVFEHELLISGPTTVTPLRWSQDFDKAFRVLAYILACLQDGSTVSPYSPIRNLVVLDGKLSLCSKKILAFHGACRLFLFNMWRICPSPPTQPCCCPVSCLTGPTLSLLVSFPLLSGLWSSFIILLLVAIYNLPKLQPCHSPFSATYTHW